MFLITISLAHFIFKFKDSSHNCVDISCTHCITMCWCLCVHDKPIAYLSEWLDKLGLLCKIHCRYTVYPMKYALSFCHALFHCGYIMIFNRFVWSIYSYLAGLLHWHWGNCMILRLLYRFLGILHIYHTITRNPAFWFTWNFSKYAICIYMVEWISQAYWMHYISL